MQKYLQVPGFWLPYWIFYMFLGFSSKLAVEAWTRLKKKHRKIDVVSPSVIININISGDNLMYEINVIYLRK